MRNESPLLAELLQLQHDMKATSNGLDQMLNRGASLEGVQSQSSSMSRAGCGAS